MMHPEQRLPCPECGESLAVDDECDCDPICAECGERYQMDPWMDDICDHCRRQNLSDAG